MGDVSVSVSAGYSCWEENRCTAAVRFVFQTSLRFVRWFVRHLLRQAGCAYLEEGVGGTLGKSGEVGGGEPYPDDVNDCFSGAREQNSPKVEFV